MIRPYVVGVKGKEWDDVIWATSRGAAKYRYLLRVQEAWEGISFQHLTCSASGSMASIRKRKVEALQYTAERRGLPNVRIGMRVIVGGHRGVLVGSNDSGNFDICFEEGPHTGQAVNCHPHESIEYLYDSIIPKKV